MSLIPRTRRGALWRFFAGAVVVIACAAGTTAVAGLLQFKQVVTYLNETKPFQHLKQLTLPPPGEPQTLLLIGSDHRAGTPFSSANTDTMMLVRLNASSSTINVLSIPRDLQVQLPDGTAKLNAAYSEGGPSLLLGTLKTQVFPGLVVNHVLDLNFHGFAELVNAIGCVYTDVDHRYYNDTALTDYSSIDVQPGYQKLCGTQALAFVRFRHTDSDIVRNARQQDFIRWAKDAYGVDQLLANRNRLLAIFGANVQTDQGLHSLDQVIDLFNLVVDADGHTIRSIPFPYVFGPCGGGTSAELQTPCYVFASSQAAEEAAYQRFVTPTVATTGSGARTTATAHTASPAPAGAAPTAGLALDPADGHSQAAALGQIAMPIYYPKRIVAGSLYCFASTANCDDPSEPASEYMGSYPRTYTITGSDGTPWPAYRMTIDINSALGEYYGIQGTTWQHPPILNNPTRTVTVAGKTLLEYFNGGLLSLVAWRTPVAVYWVSNTLTDSIPTAQLVGVAASLTPYAPAP